MSRILASAMRAFQHSEQFGAGASPPSFRIEAGPGIDISRVLDPNCLARLRGYRPFQDSSMIIHVHERSDADAVLGRKKPPYAYRAFTRDGVSHIFVDQTETPRSLCWLIAHELTHQVVDKSPTIKAAMADASSRGTGIDPAGDEFHAVDAEERFCDGVATKLVGERLDRAWWRRRTKAIRQ